MNIKILFFTCLLLPLTGVANEDSYNDRFCEELGGERETIHRYKYGYETLYMGKPSSYIMVDCETTTYVWEGGMDTRSSLDSV